MSNKLQENREPRFTDYLSILYKWRRFLIINLSVVLILSTIVSFLIPKTYKAVSTVTLSSASSSGGLGALLGRNSALSMGASLLGLGGSDGEDVIFGLIGSRSLQDELIDKFNLFDYYSIDDRNYDKVRKAMIGDLVFDPNDYGFIEVSYVHEEPQIAADIVNYIVSKVDSMNVQISIESAKRNRLFIEKRYNKCLLDLERAEEEYKAFQQANGAISLPEQVKMGVKYVAELETQLLEKKIILNGLEKNINKNSVLYKTILNQIEAIAKQKKELNKKYNNDSFVEKVFLAFEDMPSLQIEYFRLYRELEIQNKVLEFLYPLFEQAKMEEYKNIPTLITIDEAVAPQLKYAPKKAFIIISVTLLFLFLLLPLVFNMDRFYIVEHDMNDIERLGNMLSKRIVSLYKLKI